MQAIEATKPSFTSTMLELYQNEGLMRFWSGMPALLLGVVPAHAFYFSIYEAIRKLLHISENSTVGLA